MPTQEDIAHYERLVKYGICSCGKKADEHADTFDQIPHTAINCKLTKSELVAWHTPRQMGG